MLRSMGFAWDVFADFYHDSTPLIIAIRRDQMPKDIRSAFLDEDVIISYRSHGNITPFGRTRARHRRDPSLVTPKCVWCRADNVCAGLIMIMTVLVGLGAASIQHKDTLAFYVLRYVLSVLSVTPLVLFLAAVYIQYMSDGCSNVSLRCSQGVKIHCVYSLASRIVSTSSLLLLQQPLVNLRSFFRYHKFFSKMQPGRLSDEEVDSCIRHLAAEDPLGLTALIGDGSYALLGLEPCQDMFLGLGWGFSWLNVLYQSYRDWKRWRLATMMCERFQAGGHGLWHTRAMDGHIGNLLACLGGRGGHKWFLVDPELFVPKLPSKLRKA